MLSVGYLRTALSVLKEFTDPDRQIIQGNGLDGVISLLDEMRSVSFPCVVLEAGGSGSCQLYDGPVDTFTQSVWVMGRLGRGEDEAALYLEMKALSRKVTARILEDSGAGVAGPDGIDWTRYSYMQRWGGQNARGFELIFTFRENFSLLVRPEDLKPRLVRVADYLYGVDIYDPDYDYAMEYFRKHGPANAPGACSSVSFRYLYGGNLDWFYDNEVEFVVRTPKRGGRLSTIGVAGTIAELTRDAVENGRHEEMHRLIPFFMNDGMNEAGVYCKVNVVPDDKGRTTKSVPEEEAIDEICSTMLVRFVLDHFPSAQAAVDYLRRHVSIYHPAKLLAMGYEAHWMIADGEHSFVVEIIENRITVSESRVMTNFYIDGVTFNEDGGVWTPEDVADGHRASDNGVTEHGSGLERFNLAVAMLPSVTDRQGVRSLLNSLLYSRTYLSAPDVADPIWHTEYVGRNLTVDSPAEDFGEIEAEYAEIFSRRDRDTPEQEARTWHSTHSSVYDAVSRRLYLVSQENMETEYEFAMIDGE